MGREREEEEEGGIKEEREEREKGERGERRRGGRGEVEEMASQYCFHQALFWPPLTSLFREP